MPKWLVYREETFYMSKFVEADDEAGAIAQAHADVFWGISDADEIKEWAAIMSDEVAAEIEEN